MKEELREYLLSIISQGNKSPYINPFVSALTVYAIQYLNIKVNNITIQRLCEENSIYYDDRNDRLSALAMVCIAEIFEDRNGVCYKINDFFLYKGFDVSSASIELIISKLRTLVWCQCRNYIFEINNPNYVRLRNALNLCLNRYPGFKKIASEKDYFLYSCSADQIDISKPQMEIDSLTNKLLDLKLDNPSNPDLMKAIFAILNSQDQYSKAVYYNLVVQCILEYYQKLFVTIFGYKAKEKENSEGEKMEPSEKGIDIVDFTQFEEDFHIKFSEFILKNRIYKTIIDLKIKYIYSCKKSDLNFTLEPYPESKSLIDLNNNNLKNIEIFKIMEIIFKEINQQSIYNKVIIYISLAKIILIFYRMFLDV